MLTEAGSAFSNSLPWFFNLVWEWEVYPSMWKHSHIRYLHKKGDKFDLSNYRPISLISCLGKAFTCLLLPRLQNALSPHIAPEQGGFQKNSGCVGSLWTLSALVDCTIAHQRKSDPKKGAAYAIFCDTKEAFDSVWRDGLYFTLHAYGVRGKLLRLIVAWHVEATATGLSYQTESSPIKYSQGVRQGCILAPALYAAFLNPLMGDTPPVADHPFPKLHAWAFKDGLSREDGLLTPSAENGYMPRRVHVPGLMYADDVAILACTREGAEASFIRYTMYTRKWRSRLSPLKCHLLVFGKQTRKIKPIVCPCGHILKPY